jgi:pyruvate,water dikinase
LQGEYKSPVDIEFTVNSVSKDEHIICLLQCRPLKVYSEKGRVAIPAKKEDEILFRTEKCSMGLPQATKIDLVVSIDPKSYYEYPYARKTELVRALEEINQSLKGSGKTAMLIAPGRLGTSSPELGVPVRFAGISNFSIVAEVDDADSGYCPELSYGSHLFQDLVESEIFYTAIFKNNDKKSKKRAALLGRRSVAVGLPEKHASVGHIAYVFDTSDSGLKLYYDIGSGTALCSF